MEILVPFTSFTCFVPGTMIMAPVRTSFRPFGPLGRTSQALHVGSSAKI